MAENLPPAGGQQPQYQPMIQQPNHQMAGQYAAASSAQQTGATGAPDMQQTYNAPPDQQYQQYQQPPPVQDAQLISFD